jgi:hypothetical protein
MCSRELVLPESGSRKSINSALFLGPAQISYFSYGAAGLKAVLTRMNTAKISHPRKPLMLAGLPTAISLIFTAFLITGECATRLFSFYYKKQNPS